MTDKLLPCPFCGSEFVQVRYMGGEWQEPSAFESGYRGECCDCYAITRAFYTEEEAIAAWNTRAERTCHPKFNGTWFECDVCGWSLARFGVRTTQRLDGTTIRKMAAPMNYCPHCGARTVGE